MISYPFPSNQYIIAIPCNAAGPPLTLRHLGPLRRPWTGQRSYRSPPCILIHHLAILVLRVYLERQSGWLSVLHLQLTLLASGRKLIVHVGELIEIDRLPVVLSSTASLELWFLLYYIIHGCCLLFPSITPEIYNPKYSPYSGVAATFLRLVQTSLCCAGSCNIMTHVRRFMNATLFKSIQSELSNRPDVAKMRRLAR